MTKKFAKGGVKKYQTAGTSKAKKETPFQQYMKTPGAVASDTIASRQPALNNSGKQIISQKDGKPLYEKNKIAKPTKSQALIDAFEKTYGRDIWDRSYWTGITRNKNLSPSEEKDLRRMGPTLKRGGVKKYQYAGTSKESKPTVIDSLKGQQDLTKRKKAVEDLIKKGKSPKPLSPILTPGKMKRGGMFKTKPTAKKSMTVSRKKK
jgi:hypothetical protein